MIKKAILLLPLLVLLIVISCNNSNTSEKESKQHEASIMYEPSELASLMLSMHNQHQAWKIQLEKDSLISTFPEEFLGIYTVTPTDSNVRTSEFVSFADNYINKVEKLLSAKRNKKEVKLFNASIDACIDCHSKFCQGPIDKIKKLYITN